MSHRFSKILAIALVSVGFLSSHSVSAQVATTSAEYRYTAQYNDYIGPFTSEIWARVYRPSTLTSGTRYPLIVMLHGNHGTCGRNGTSPRVDGGEIVNGEAINWRYSIDGTCPSTHSVVKNHEGYAYLANDLASRGYIVVSINANRGFHGLYDTNDDVGQVHARGRLVLWHLGLLSSWNNGATTPASLGVSLQNRIDFTQVGLMGHSRGALGVRATVALYRDESMWRNYFIQDPVTFRSLLEIAAPAPPGGASTPVPDSRDVALLSMVGMCDTDVNPLDIGTQFDRLIRSGSSDTGAHFKAIYGIHGGNHNYFNTEWQENEAEYGCENQTPLFTGASTEIGSQSQRDAALAAVRNFFTATVGAKKDPSLMRIFDPVYAAPSGPKIDRAFSASPTYANSLRLEEFTGPTGTNSNWVANGTPSGGTVTYEHVTGGIERDFDYPSANVSWGTKSSNKYLQINWAFVNSGWDLRTYPYLEFRVDRNDITAAAAPEFSIRLVNANGTLSTNTLSSTSYVTLSPLPATKTGDMNPTYYHPVMKTVRIPLSAFTGVDLSKVRGVRFIFNRTDNGQLKFAQINATVDSNLAKGRPVTASSVQDNNSTLAASKAVDGSTSSRWSSAFSDSQWIYTDLGFSQKINSVILRWETAYGRDFKIQVSNNASTWTDAHTVTGGTGGTQIINLASTATGRYVRMLGTRRGTQWGYSLYEFEVYGH